LKYLKKKAEEQGYTTDITRRYLAVFPKKKSKVILSSHIDRHGFIKNEEGNIEYLAFYLRKKLGIPFKFEKIEDKEKELITKNSDFLLTDSFLLWKHNDTKIKFLRDGRTWFFEKTAERHSRENIYSYNPITGETINHYTLIRSDTNVLKKEVLFTPNKPLKDEDSIFAINAPLFQSNNLISGQIDNVISAAVLFTLLEEQELTSTLLFTTQEEIGNSYQSIVEFYKKHSGEKLYIIDTSPYENLEKGEKGFLTLREGDERGGFSREMGKEIKNILKEMKIPYDIKPSCIGNTELGAVVEHTNGKLNGTTLQLPTTNYHTSFETCTKESLNNYYKVLKKLF
jgi:hypothetical protein